MKVLVVLLIVLLLYAQIVFAQENKLAPVQADYWIDDQHYMYDCWPYGGEEMNSGLIVYLNRPDGIAAYRCDITGQYGVTPIVPRRDDMAFLLDSDF